MQRKSTILAKDAAYMHIGGMRMQPITRSCSQIAWRFELPQIAGHNCNAYGESKPGVLNHFIRRTS